MLAGLRQVLVNPTVGLIAMAVAFALAVTLGVLARGWEVERARYEARITELDHAAQRAEAGLRTELASCEATVQTREATAADFAARGPTTDGARRLLEQQPEGIDACARMESADQAVLSNLKK
jgi:hypothetical protein